MSSLQGYLLDAAAASPNDANVWYQLGLTNIALGQTQIAEACLQRSLSLKQTEPVLPFANLSFKL